MVLEIERIINVHIECLTTLGFVFKRSKMTSDTLQTISQFTILIGFVMMALGGFGSYHFGKKAEKTRQQETQNSFDKLLTQNQELNVQLKPSFCSSPRQRDLTSTKMLL